MIFCWSGSSLPKYPRWSVSAVVWTATSGLLNSWETMAMRSSILAPVASLRALMALATTLRSSSGVKGLGM